MQSRVTSYYRKRKASSGLSKRPAKRVAGRRRAVARKRTPTAALRVIRWSSATGQNSHVEITGADLVPSGIGTSVFRLANMNGFAELVSLFDNYRINRVLYRWVITRNPSEVPTAANKGLYPRLVWTHDFNDQQPISRDLIYQRSNMKEYYFGDNKQVSPWYSIRPASLAVSYESATESAYAPKWGVFMDTSDNNTPHYGIKYAYDQLYGGVTLRMEAKIICECRGIS